LVVLVARTVVPILLPLFSAALTLQLRGAAQDWRYRRRGSRSGAGLHAAQLPDCWANTGGPVDRNLQGLPHRHQGQASWL